MIFKKNRIIQNSRIKPRMMPTMSDDMNSESGISIKETSELKMIVVDEDLGQQLELNNTRRQLEKELSIKHYFHQKLLETLDLALLSSLDVQTAKQQLQEAIIQLMAVDTNHPMSSELRKKILKQIEDEVFGLGPLEPLLQDQTVSDILVNGAKSVYVERDGRLEQTPYSFLDDQHLRNIIDRIVSQVGRRIDESSPMVDARLIDGSRINAVIPPLAIDGPSLSIRRFSTGRLVMKNLLTFGSISSSMAKFIQAAVRGELNILISGGTGSGKTTTLNILSGFIPESERIITIEDSAELQLQQPHVVRLETRPANLEGKGEIDQRELVKNALRMRPDRIVVGEVRGSEAVDMLTAMNTGHDGSLATIHANTPRDALSRIENMFAMAGWNFSAKNLRAQIASAIHLVVQMERQEDGKRRMTSIQEINGMEGEVITMSEIFKFVRSGVNEKGEVQGQYIATGIIPDCFESLLKRGIDLPVDIFYE